MKIKMTVIFFILAWITLVTVSFLWNYSNAKQEQERIALQSARSFFDQILITRLWNSRHGGVYVPVTETTRPNPYLKLAMRDIKVNDKLTLTNVNPAYMSRQLSEIALDQKGVQFHITSHIIIHRFSQAHGPALPVFILVMGEFLHELFR